MKFFELIQLSNYQIPNWAYPCDAPDTPVPSRPLYYLCSKPHNLLPKSDAPNIFYPKQETLAVVSESYDPLSFSPSCLYSSMVDTRYVCEHDPCSPPPLISEHSQHYIFAPPDHDNVAEYHLSKHGNDILSPIQYVRSFYLPYVNSFDILPYSKTMNFIETKVAAINCRVLTSN